MDEPVPAGLMRRLAALVYDLLLLAAVLMVVTALFLPFTGGDAITGAHPLLRWAHRCALALVIVLFYGRPWTRNGQTLGMASWRLRLEREDGARLTWGDTMRRLAAALVSLLPAGLGWLWIAVDQRKRAWHDRLSHTRVVRVPK